MSYYQRPMGDYKTYGYAGDPGFLSSLWKGIKLVGKSILGIPPKPQPGFGMPGVAGPVGVGVGGVTAIDYFLPARPGGPDPGAGAKGPSMPGFKFPTAGACNLPQGPTRGSVIMTGGCCPAGYHPVKTGAGYCVRNRRMNVANPRALRKGMRRVQGFEKLARRTISFTKRTRIKKRPST